MRWLLWLCYFVGQVAHTLKRADLSASSSATYGGFRDWFARNWKNAFYRMVIDTVLFLVWLDPGTYFANAMIALGLGKFVGMLPVPSVVSPAACAVAMAFGVFADTGVDYLVAKFWPSTMKESPAKS